MPKLNSQFDEYFSHLQRISFQGRMYKRYFSSRLLYWSARRFGHRILEVGSGTGSGVLGAYPKQLRGLDINPHAVTYCQAAGLDAQLIASDGTFPFEDGLLDVCILDNVLEHIGDPTLTLDECSRVTSPTGGLVVAVPGVRGYLSDEDHKKFYSASDLEKLDLRWQLKTLHSMPFYVQSERLSKAVRQYCLLAVYQKLAPER